MIDWTHRCIVVQDAIASQCRSLAAQLPGGAGMWTTPLSATGAAPATHWVSSGLVWPQFADMLASPEALVDGLTQMGIACDLATAQYLLAHADVSTEQGQVALARLGLQIVQEAA
jgi:hypothetical protein